MPARTAYAAVVLDGGRSRRMGGVDKPSLRIAGRTLRARVVAAVSDAAVVVLVGPPSPAGVVDPHESHCATFRDV